MISNKKLEKISKSKRSVPNNLRCVPKFLAAETFCTQITLHTYASYFFDTMVSKKKYRYFSDTFWYRYFWVSILFDTNFQSIDTFDTTRWFSFFIFFSSTFYDIVLNRIYLFFLMILFYDLRSILEIETCLIINNTVS